jgi:hypothetical protein
MEPDSGARVVPLPTTPVSWVTPLGWQEQPRTETRQGSFKAIGPDGTSADVAVASFPGAAGGVEANLNRWRGQVHLPPLASGELESITQPLDVDDRPGLLVDVQTPGGAEKPSRILGAVFQTPERSWFVKMTGDPAFLETQKARFLEFVQSFRFGNPAGAGGCRWRRCDGRQGAIDQ